MQQAEAHEVYRRVRRRVLVLVGRELAVTVRVEHREEDASIFSWLFHEHREGEAEEAADRADEQQEQLRDDEPRNRLEEAAQAVDALHHARLAHEDELEHHVGGNATHKRAERAQRARHVRAGRVGLHLGPARPRAAGDPRQVRPAQVDVVVVAAVLDEGDGGAKVDERLHEEVKDERAQVAAIVGRAVGPAPPQKQHHATGDDGTRARDGDREDVEHEERGEAVVVFAPWREARHAVAHERVRRERRAHPAGVEVVVDDPRVLWSRTFEV